MHQRVKTSAPTREGDVRQIGIDLPDARSVGDGTRHPAHAGGAVVSAAVRAVVDGDVTREFVDVDARVRSAEGETAVCADEGSLAAGDDGVLGESVFVSGGVEGKRSDGSGDERK